MEKRGSIVGGLILIAAGMLFLTLEIFPGVGDFIDMGRQWPLLIIGLGGVFLLVALAGNPPVAVPGSILTGIGGILYYQNLTGNWASWAFVWALIPGFVGIGIILSSLLGGRTRPNVREGVRLVGFSLAMFLIFGAFFNGLGGLGDYWPVLLIVLGGWLLIKNRR